MFFKASDLEDLLLSIYSNNDHPSLSAPDFETKGYMGVLRSFKTTDVINVVVTGSQSDVETLHFIWNDFVCRKYV